MQRANPAARLRSTDGGGWSGRLGWTVISLLGFLAFWELMALIIQSRHLPGPIVVVQAMVQEMLNGELAHHVGITLLRVAAAFVIAMCIGSAIGILLDERLPRRSPLRRLVERVHAGGADGPPIRIHEQTSATDEIHVGVIEVVVSEIINSHALRGKAVSGDASYLGNNCSISLHSSSGSSVLDIDLPP